MIIHLQPSIGECDFQELATHAQAVVFHDGIRHVLVTPSSIDVVSEAFEHLIESTYATETDLQLGSRKYIQETRKVDVDGVVIGRASNTVVIAGPCAIESKTQIEESASFMKSAGLNFLRGGAYKPRTSPYSFQGLGLEGLQLLSEMRRQHGLKIVTEVRDATHVEEVIEHADIIQIGAKSMYDHGILKACSRTHKPILIKRGFGTTLQEFAQAAEFVLSGGNPNVMLCERGIRTFETKTRFTLDLCGVAWLKENTNLPIILDPSHAMGYRYGIKDLSKACVAMGVDGLMLEVHPDPSSALSDKDQQLTHAEFTTLLEEIKPVAEAVGRTLI